MLLVEAYVADSLAPSEASVGRLAALLDAFPGRERGAQGVGKSEGEGAAAPDPPLQEASKFTAAAVQWLRRWVGGWWPACGAAAGAGGLQ